MHEGQAWSRGPQVAMPAADAGSCLRDCPAPCIPLPPRYPTFGVSVFKLSSCYGCFSRCGFSNADFYLKVELQLQVLLPPSEYACPLSQCVAGYTLAGLKRPKTGVPVVQEDGKSCRIGTDEGWQEEGRVHCPSEVCFGLLLLTSG